jgi:hypothetical protein
MRYALCAMRYVGFDWERTSEQLKSMGIKIRQYLLGFSGIHKGVKPQRSLYIKFDVDCLWNLL